MNDDSAVLDAVCKSCCDMVHQPFMIPFTVPNIDEVELARFRVREDALGEVTPINPDFGRHCPFRQLGQQRIPIENCLEIRNVSLLQQHIRHVVCVMTNTLANPLH